MTSLYQTFRNAIFGAPEEYRKRRASMDRIDAVVAKKEPKAKIFSINELNEKFIRNNLYFILFGVIVYIAVGVGVYHHVMKWTRLDTLYFLVVTLLTIGYGDYHPISEREKVFTAFFIIFGIAICSSALGSISTMMQSHQERMNKLRNMRAMLLMKEEEEAEERAKSFAANDGAGNISLSALQAAARQALVTDEEAPAPPPTVVTSPLAEIQEETEAETLSEVGDRQKSSSFAFPKRRPSRGFLDMAMSLSIERPRQKTLKELRDASLYAFEEDYYQMMRASIFDFVAIFVILIVGMIGMHIVEGWSYGVSFYWATVTIMTVGYGDVTPTSVRGKVFTIFYCVIGCAFMAKVLTDFIRYPLLARMVRNEEEVARQFTGVSNSPELLENIFDNELHKLVPDLKRNPDEMTKCEFVLVLLHLMNKIEEKDVFLAAKLFDDMDVDFKGYFSRQDMTEKVSEAVERSKHQLSRINIDEVNNARGSFNNMNNIFGTLTRRFSDAGLEPPTASSPTPSDKKRIPFGRSRSEKSERHSFNATVSQSWSNSRADFMKSNNKAAMQSSLLDPTQKKEAHQASSFGGTSSSTLYVPPSATLRPFSAVSSVGNSTDDSNLFAPSKAPIIPATVSSSGLSKLFQPSPQQPPEGKDDNKHDDDIYKY